MPSKQNLQPLLDAIQRDADGITSTSDSLDGKALGILGFNIALALFALQAQTDNPWWLLVPMFGLFGLSSLLTIIIIWPRDYVGPSVPLSKHPEYLQMPEEELLLQLIANGEKAIETNTKPTLLKSHLCVGALWLSLAGVGLLIWCIL